MKINERSKFIINRFLQENSVSSYVTASDIAVSLKVSVKTVTRQLSDVEKMIGRCGMMLERKTGRGMRLLGSRDAKERLRRMVESSTSHDYSPDERGNIILSHLLKSQEPVKLQVLAQLLGVADTTVSNDLDRLEPWLSKAHLQLVRRPGLGVYLTGLEKDIRKAIINHIYEHSSEKDMLNLLYERSAASGKLLSDADRFLLDLVDKNIIQKVESAVKTAMHEQGCELSLDSFSGLVVHLTLAVQRLLKGERISIDEQFLADMRGKDEFAAALSIAKQIENIFSISVPEAETAYVAMHLMGARNNYQKALMPEYSDVFLIKVAKQIITAAEKASGVSIARKSRLLVGLVKHLGPAAVRLKLKMDIRNPLLAQMKEQYPQWMKIAKAASIPLEEALGVKLPESETAYIAMHLGAALEESSVSSRLFKVLVACPTGLATSKLLASQLRRSFANIQIAAIVSAVNVDYQLYRREKVDFIISTVPIENAQLPVVVVGFMLSSQDKEAVKAQMTAAAVMHKVPQQLTAGRPLTERLNSLNAYADCICKVINGFFYQSDIEAADLEELCRKAAQAAADDKAQVQKLSEAFKAREQLGSTVVDGLILLHARSKDVQRLASGIIQLSSEISIGGRAVRSALVLLVPQKADVSVPETVGCIAENLADNPSLITVLHEASQQEINAELEKMYAQFFKEKYKQIMEV